MRDTVVCSVCNIPIYNVTTAHVPPEAPWLDGPACEDCFRRTRANLRVEWLNEHVDGFDMTLPHKSIKNQSDRYATPP